MLDNVFGTGEEAKITIEIGDYKVKMEGYLDPPAITTDRFEGDFYSRRKFGTDQVYNDIQEVLLKLRPKGKIDIEQFRWSIPIAIAPRIEKQWSGGGAGSCLFQESVVYGQLETSQHGGG